MQITWRALILIAVAACAPPTEQSGDRVLIQNKGSDTLVNVAQAWAEEYKEINPNVAVAVTGGGSGTGISAMINGTVDIANASRKMKDKEIEMAQGNGIDPIEWVVGYDALAVYVHLDNPVAGFSLGELAEIYGEEGATENWSELGIEIPGCDSGEIVRVSRQNNSGTYVYFKEAVLGKARDYKLGSRDMHGSKDVVDLVLNTPCAIGYSGLAYATEEVRMPCVTAEEGGDCVAPSTETAIGTSWSGTIPQPGRLWFASTAATVSSRPRARSRWGIHQDMWRSVTSMETRTWTSSPPTTGVIR